MCPVMVSENTEPETKSEAVARLMRQGGFILVAGGGCNDLPDKIKNHPQVRVWDDNDQAFHHKTVPSNTRAILTKKWISHQNMARLRHAATQLNIPIFPMLATREVKELMAEFIGLEPVPTEVIEEIEIPEVESQPVRTVSSLLMEEDIVKKPKSGELTAFIEKKLAKNIDWKVRGAIAAEGRRLFPMAKEAGIKTTEASIKNVVGIFVRKGGEKTPRTYTKAKVEAESTVGVSDDFAEAEKMLRDARAAIDLFLDFIPKIRKEATELRKRQAKIKELLG